MKRKPRLKIKKLHNRLGKLGFSQSTVKRALRNLTSTEMLGVVTRAETQVRQYYGRRKEEFLKVVAFALQLNNLPNLSFFEFLNLIDLHEHIILEPSEVQELNDFYCKIKNISHSQCRRRSRSIQNHLLLTLQRIDIQRGRRRWSVEHNKKNEKKLAHLNKKNAPVAQKPQPRKSKTKSLVTTEELLLHRKTLPTVGLGCQSITKIPRVKSEEVVIDDNTSQRRLNNHLLK